MGIDLAHLTPMSPDETASLRVIAGDQSLFRYRDKAGATAYKFISPAAVRTAFSHERIDTGWLPSNACRGGMGKLGEWLLVTHPPKRYAFAFTTGQGSETKTLAPPMPALAFFGYGSKYYLWGFPDRELNANSPLFTAPLPNVEGNGAICFGQNVLPPASTKTMGEAWNLFLMSPFSNHSVNGKSREFPEDVRKHLEKLAQANRRRYPLRDLMPLRETASQMIDVIVRGVRV